MRSVGYRAGQSVAPVSGDPFIGTTVVISAIRAVYILGPEKLRTSSAIYSSTTNTFKHFRCAQSTLYSSELAIVLVRTQQ